MTLVHVVKVRKTAMIKNQSQDGPLYILKGHILQFCKVEVCVFCKDLFENIQFASYMMTLSVMTRAISFSRLVALYPGCNRTLRIR